MSYDRIWRDPDEESVGLYPNLVVHDGRQRGSITIGRSRLPIWSVIYTAIEHGWDEVERGWAPTEHYGFTARDLAEFVHSICQVRGEFARLVLLLADAERSDYADDNDVWPSFWWEDPERTARIVGQLRRCLAALDESEDA